MNERMGTVSGESTPRVETISPTETLDIQSVWYSFQERYGCHYIGVDLDILEYELESINPFNRSHRHPSPPYSADQKRPARDWKNFLMERMTRHASYSGAVWERAFDWARSALGTLEYLNAITAQEHPPRRWNPSRHLLLPQCRAGGDSLRDWNGHYAERLAGLGVQLTIVPDEAAGHKEQYWRETLTKAWRRLPPRIAVPQIKPLSRHQQEARDVERKALVNPYFSPNSILTPGEFTQFHHSVFGAVADSKDTARETVEDDEEKSLTHSPSLTANY